METFYLKLRQRMIWWMHENQKKKRKHNVKADTENTFARVQFTFIIIALSMSDSKR